MNQPKILTLDIETSPHIASVWGLFQQNVSLNQLRECTTVISWAAKWHGDKKVLFRSDFHDGHDVLVSDMWDLLDEADIVLGWNQKGFDLKHLNREFLLAGMLPPSKYHVLDLMLETRRNFKFASNKLDHVSQQLDIGSKLHHTGMDLWNGCVIENGPEGLGDDETLQHPGRQADRTSVRRLEALAEAPQHSLVHGPGRVGLHSVRLRQS